MDGCLRTISSVACNSNLYMYIVIILPVWRNCKKGCLLLCLLSHDVTERERGRESAIL